MPMVCPQCSGTFDNLLQCPQCNVRLLFQPVRAGEGGAGRWHETLSGRFLVGLLLAVGLCFGFLQLATALVKAFNKDGLGPEAALAVFLGVQALALFLSGLLTGAGQWQAGTLGVTVGIVSGALAIMALLSGALSGVIAPLAAELLDPSKPARTAILFVLPIVHAVFGGLGGVVGSLIWRPPFNVDLAALAGNKLPAAEGRTVQAAKAQTPSFTFAGPISWVRVIIGVVAAVVGAVSPQAIISILLDLLRDYLEKPDPQQIRFLTAEIFSVSIMFGGCIAGATTINGIKQGLCVGVGAGIFMA